MKGIQATNLQDLLSNFGIVTVMDVRVFKIKQYKKRNFISQFIDIENSIFLDTLKISNIQESGPNKVFKAGLHNVPLIRQGKTVSIEMTDALGKLCELETFFGLQRSSVSNSARSLYSSNKFAEPIALEGKTFVIDLDGQLKELYIFIPFFIPNSILNLTQDPSSDFGVFDIGGQAFPAYVQRKENNEQGHYEYYSLSYESILNHFSEDVDHDDDLTIYSIYDATEKDIAEDIAENIENNNAIEIIYSNEIGAEIEEWVTLQHNDNIILNFPQEQN